MATHFRYGICVALGSLLILGVLPGLAHGQAETSGAQYRIGVVDMQYLLAEYNKRKQKYEDLQKEVDSLQEEIDKMSAKIEADTKVFRDSQATMSDTERFNLKTQIETAAATYRGELERRQRIIDNMEEQVLIEVMKDVQATIDQVAQAGNYHLILNARGGPRGTVLYFSPTIDITSQVLTQLNAAK